MWLRRRGAGDNGDVLPLPQVGLRGAASSTEFNFDTVPSSTLLLCSLSSADGLKLF